MATNLDRFTSRRRVESALVVVTLAAAVIAGSAPTVGANHPCGFGTATIHGTAGDDTIQGTPGDDVIVGLGGNDRIFGLGGNDALCGGPGNDRLDGGDGNDGLIGEDNAFGTQPRGGNDLLNAGAGFDFMIGDYFGQVAAAGGQDELVDPDGGATMAGDSLASGSGTVSGTGGRDAIRIGGPVQFVIGDNSGRSASGTGGPDTITTAAGADLVIGDNASFETAFPASGQGGSDYLDTREGADRLWGDNASSPDNGVNFVTTGTSGGLDKLIAGAGNDTLRGGPNTDKCDGGAGTDSAPDGDCEDRISIP